MALREQGSGLDFRVSGFVFKFWDLNPVRQLIPRQIRIFLESNCRQNAATITRGTLQAADRHVAILVTVVAFGRPVQLYDQHISWFPLLAVARKFCGTGTPAWALLFTPVPPTPLSFTTN